MTIHLPGHDGVNVGRGDGLSAPTVNGAINQRHETHFNNARRHSFMVGFLKGALPVLALGLVAWFIAMSLLANTGIENVTVKSAGISNGKLIMESPKLNGFNKKNNTYNLIANRAVQDLKKPSIIQLENIHAKIPLDTGGYADVAANAGTYNSDKEWLSLSKDILVVGKDGTEIELDTAEIDLKKGNLSSNSPVTVKTPTANIQADGLEVVDNGSVIIFTQRVRVTIQPATPKN